MKLYAVTLAMLLSTEDPMHSAWGSVERTRGSAPPMAERLMLAGDDYADGSPVTLRCPVARTCVSGLPSCFCAVEVCS